MERIREIGIRKNCEMDKIRMKVRIANSGFKKLAVKCLKQYLCFGSSVALADRFDLRNP